MVNTRTKSSRDIFFRMATVLIKILHAFCQKEPKDSRDSHKHLCRIYNITINPKVEAVSPVSLFPRFTLFCTCDKNTVNVCFFLSVTNPNKTEHSHLWLPLCQFPLACEADKETTRATSQKIYSEQQRNKWRLYRNL